MSDEKTLKFTFGTMEYFEALGIIRREMLSVSVSASLAASGFISNGLAKFPVDATIDRICPTCKKPL